MKKLVIVLSALMLVGATTSFAKSNCGDDKKEKSCCSDKSSKKSKKNKADKKVASIENQSKSDKISKTEIKSVETKQEIMKADKF